MQKVCRGFLSTGLCIVLLELLLMFPWRSPYLFVFVASI